MTLPFRYGCCALNKNNKIRGSRKSKIKERKMLPAGTVRKKAGEVGSAGGPGEENHRKE